MDFKLFLESHRTDVWYHGRTVNNDTFSLDYVGGENATDQEGPGFYFTNSLEDSKKYTGPQGIILACNIAYRKTYLCRTKGKPSEWIIRRLIKKAPDYLDSLTNFGENPEQAFYQAVNIYMQNDNPSDAYQTIANDFYHGNPKLYLQVLGRHLDGHFASWVRPPLQHLIIYKPEIIKVIDKIAYST